MEKRKLLLSIMVVGMCSSAVLALAPMGPPVAGLPQGQYSAGFGYAFSKMNLELSGPIAGMTTGRAELDVESNIYYGFLGYGISDDWNIWGAVAGADAEFDGEGVGTTYEGSDFAFAIGTVRTLAESPDGKTKWGASCQYSWGQTDDKLSTGSRTFLNGATGTFSGTPKIELKMYEVQVAVGPARQVSDDCLVYGGPFLHFVEGDLDIRDSRNEYELEQLWELGAFIGTAINLGDDATLDAEFRLTDQAWGWNVGATFGLK